MNYGKYKELTNIWSSLSSARDTDSLSDDRISTNPLAHHSLQRRRSLEYIWLGDLTFAWNTWIKQTKVHPRLPMTWEQEAKYCRHQMSVPLLQRSSAEDWKVDSGTGRLTRCWNVVLEYLIGSRREQRRNGVHISATGQSNDQIRIVIRIQIRVHNFIAFALSYSAKIKLVHIQSAQEC